MLNPSGACSREAQSNFPSPVHGGRSRLKETLASGKDHGGCPRHHVEHLHHESTSQVPLEFVLWPSGLRRQRSHHCSAEVVGQPLCHKCLLRLRCTDWSSFGSARTESTAHEQHPCFHQLFGLRLHDESRVRGCVGVHGSQRRPVAPEHPSLLSVATSPCATMTGCESSQLGHRHAPAPQPSKGTSRHLRGILKPRP